ncbi:MAG TPA: hypothetical protein VF844_05035 [Ktedonobacteraceae bacterium]
MRRRTGQIVPVAFSFLLLMGAVQSIGTLHEISSQLVRQQITRGWRSQYDLLMRPQSAVSEPERSAGWVDPQSILETYGGISSRQIASISTIAHVVQVVSIATAGWQPVEVLLPVELAQKGVYRISAVWNGQQDKQDTENEIVRYVEVSDLAHLTNEVQLPDLDVQHLVVSDGKGPVVFTMSVQGIQAIIGVPKSQEGLIRQALLANLTPTPAIPISLHVERLRGELNSLARCVERVDCWASQQVRQGTIRYQSDGVQLLRYSRTRYAAGSQQIGAGEVTIVAPGSDKQGPLYRKLLTEHVTVPIQIEDNASEKLPEYALLPFSMPQHLPLFTDAVRFIPLEQACAINGARCYSSVYVRLSGVERYSQQSLALLQSTAASIVAHTGLHVDILDGSSLRTISLTVQAPVHMGTIANAQSMWRVVGIAVQIDHGMDALQAMLLALCSIVCLLAIGTAGVLVGIGRRKDALLLRQVGWRWYVLVEVFTFDGLALCGPGCIVAIGCTMLGTRIWASSLSPMFMWVLLAMGVLVYGCLLVTAACSGHWHSSSPAHRAKTIVEFVSGLALTSAVFLIAEGYLFMNGYDQELVVTVLGRQVHAALEGSQLLVLLTFVSASLLTVGLCSTLLLHGRRDELQLLVMVGWERRAVMLRIMWGYCSPALVSGAIGVLLAFAVAMLGDAFPTMFTALGLLICGPLLGAFLTAIATIGLAWHETGRVYRWK